MKNSKRKINWGWIIYPSVGIIIGGVAAITYISITRLIGNDSKNIKFKRSQGKSTWFDFDGKEIENEDDANQLKAMKFKVVKNDSDDSFISEEVLKMVAKKFIKRGIFGPEIGSLKTISFDDKNLISGKNVNGIYIPSTKEIGINTESINKNLLKFFKYKWPIELHELFNEIKSEAIFQVLYHEYGHHIFSSYAESPYIGKVKTIYEKNWDEKNERWNILESKWNNLFLEKFMNIFSYDDASVKPLDFNLASLQSKKDLTVGSKFSAYDLFHEININKKLPNESRVDWNKVYLNLSLKMINNFKWNRINFDNYKMTIKKEYSYLYSAEELVTRKLLLASAPFSTEAFSASWAIGIFPYDLIYDFSNFVSKSPNEPFQFNNYPVSSKTFMNDYVFKKNDDRAEKYMKLIDEVMGHKNNKNISLVWNMNNALVANDNSVIPKINSESESSNPNKIKFGGYADKQYNYVGYMDANKFVPFKIKTYKYKIGYKTSVLSGYQDTNSKDMRKKIKYYKRDAMGNIIFDKNTLQKKEDNSLSKLPYSYHLEEWINANDIKNQVLYFAEDKKGTNKKLLLGIRSDDYGGTTTFSKWSKYEIGNSNSLIWKAKFDRETNDNEQGLMITSGGFFKDAVSKIK